MCTHKFIGNKSRVLDLIKLIVSSTQIELLRLLWKNLLLSYFRLYLDRWTPKKFVNRKSKICSKTGNFGTFLKKYFKLLIKIENNMPMGLDFIRFIGKSLTNTKILGWPPILHVRQPASFHGFLCLIKKDALINDYLVVSPLKSYNW